MNCGNIGRGRARVKDDPGDGDGDGDGDGGACRELGARTGRRMRVPGVAKLNERAAQSAWENSARVWLACWLAPINYLRLGEKHGHDLYILEHDPQQFRFLLVLRFKTHGSQQPSYWKLE